MPKEKSAGAIIFRKDNNIPYYLLLHYESGHWGFPKGHIEENENEEGAARREIEEETGIKNIKIIDGFKEYEKYFFRQSYNYKRRRERKTCFRFPTERVIMQRSCNNLKKEDKKWPHGYSN